MLARQTGTDLHAISPVVLGRTGRAAGAGSLGIRIGRRAAPHRAFKLLQRCTFYLFRRHRHRRLRLERVDGTSLLILPDVFNPTLFRTGELLARYVAGLDLSEGTRVLDLGCGSGILSVFAAKAGARVVAVDINPEAVRCTRLNSLMHGLDGRIEAREGDLFGPVAGERFDLVLFNPPYFPGRAREPWEHAWRSEDALQRFIEGLPAVLAPGGRALLVLSTVARGAMETLEASGCTVRVRVERQLFGERLSIVEVIP